jgi:predicted alpha/beta superfamily hydrolase
MKYKYLIITILFFQLINVQSQNLGDLKVIDSKVLNDKREIKVLLPADYSKENKYPVVYITDANYNFEIASNYLTQLIKFNSIPKTILVGIPQKNRGNELDIFWNENGIKFKNFIFNEVIPLINREYSTSSFNTIIGHSDGAEYNHLLMMEKDNPFKGFINISENLYNDVSNDISTYFKNYKSEKLYYFIANAEYDSQDRIDAGNTIKELFINSKNDRIKFQKKTYNADHQNVLSKSLLDGILFIFQDYRNNLNYQNFKDYVENYQNNINKNYGFSPILNENDIDFFFGKVLDGKDLKMYEYLINYTSEKDVFHSNTLDRANHYFYMDEYPKTIEFWNKTVDEFKDISPRVFYFNFSKAIEAYLHLNNPSGAIEFLEKCKKRLPEYKLSFNYFIAKTALENKVKKRIGKKYLKYCEKNYIENKHFKKEDLIKLKDK